MTNKIRCLYVNLQMIVDYYISEVVKDYCIVLIYTITSSKLINQKYIYIVY